MHTLSGLLIQVSASDPDTIIYYDISFPEVALNCHL